MAPLVPAKTAQNCLNRSECPLPLGAELLCPIHDCLQAAVVATIAGRDARKLPLASDG
jgi:hypothetical protein